MPSVLVKKAGSGSNVQACGGIAILKRTVTFIGLALLFAVVALRLFVLGLSTIPQNGMYPSYPAGSHVITLRHAYSSPDAVKRGDVIVFLQVINGVQYKFIWRVVGLPGEAVATRNGRLVLNGTPAQYEPSSAADVQEERIGPTHYPVAFLPGKDPIPDAAIKVPAGSFFVLGDNRNNAADTRMYGLVPFETIVGKAVCSW